MTRARSISAALALLLFTMTGCIFVVTTSPDEFPVVSNELETLPADTKIELRNNYPPGYVTRMERMKVDLHQMTQTAVVVFGRALEARGAVLSSGGKQVTLEVAGPGWVQGFGGYYARGTLSLNAYFAGTRVSTWGEHSGTHGGSNYSAAITQAVEALLRDPKLAEYLRAP